MLKDRKAYKYHTKFTVKKVSIGIGFPCSMSVIYKKGKQMVETVSPQPMDLDTLEIVFDEGLEFESVYIKDCKTGKYIEEVNYVKTYIITHKGNKSSGGFKFKPTDYLNLGGSCFREQKVKMQKCPDRNAEMLFDIEFVRLAELNEYELKDQMDKNPNLSVITGFNFSALSSLNMTIKMKAANTSTVLQNGGTILKASKPQTSRSSKQEKSSRKGTQDDLKRTIRHNQGSSEHSQASKISKSAVNIKKFYPTQKAKITQKKTIQGEMEIKYATQQHPGAPPPPQPQESLQKMQKTSIEVRGLKNPLMKHYKLHNHQAQHTRTDLEIPVSEKHFQSSQNSQIHSSRFKKSTVQEEVDFTKKLLFARDEALIGDINRLRVNPKAKNLSLSRNFERQSRSVKINFSRNMNILKPKPDPRGKNATVGVQKGRIKLDEGQKPSRSNSRPPQPSSQNMTNSQHKSGGKKSGSVYRRNEEAVSVNRSRKDDGSPPPPPAKNIEILGNRGSSNPRNRYSQGKRGPRVMKAGRRGRRSGGRGDFWEKKDSAVQGKIGSSVRAEMAGDLRKADLGLHAMGRVSGSRRVLQNHDKNQLEKNQFFKVPAGFLGSGSVHSGSRHASVDRESSPYLSQRSKIVKSGQNDQNPKIQNQGSRSPPILKKSTYLTIAGAGSPKSSQNQPKSVKKSLTKQTNPLVKKDISRSRKTGKSRQFIFDDEFDDEDLLSRFEITSKPNNSNFTPSLVPTFMGPKINDESGRKRRVNPLAESEDFNEPEIGFKVDFQNFGNSSKKPKNRHNSPGKRSQGAVESPGKRCVVNRYRFSPVMVENEEKGDSEIKTIFDSGDAKEHEIKHFKVRRVEESGSGDSKIHKKLSEILGQPVKNLADNRISMPSRPLHEALRSKHGAKNLPIDVQNFLNQIEQNFAQKEKNLVNRIEELESKSRELYDKKVEAEEKLRLKQKEKFRILAGGGQKPNLESEELAGLKERLGEAEAGRTDAENKVKNLEVILKALRKENKVLGENLEFERKGFEERLGRKDGELEELRAKANKTGFFEFEKIVKEKEETIQELTSKLTALQLKSEQNENNFMTQNEFEIKLKILKNEVLNLKKSKEILEDEIESYKGSLKRKRRELEQQKDDHLEEIKNRDRIYTKQITEITSDFQETVQKLREQVSEYKAKYEVELNKSTPNTMISNYFPDDIHVQAESYLNPSAQQNPTQTPRAISTQETTEFFKKRGMANSAAPSHHKNALNLNNKPKAPRDNNPTNLNQISALGSSPTRQTEISKLKQKIEELETENLLKEHQLKKMKDTSDSGFRTLNEKSRQLETMKVNYRELKEKLIEMNAINLRLQQQQSITQAPNGPAGFVGASKQIAKK